MATTESLDLRLTTLETQVGELLSKSVLPSEMTQTQRKSVTDALYPEGVALKYDNPDIVVGDLVYGSGVSGINSGGFFFGEVVSLPVSSDADLNMKIQM